MDQNKVSRAVYTYFDVLGNVGGLAGVLSGVAMFVSSIFTYQDSENVLVSQLFRKNEGE